MTKLEARFACSPWGANIEDDVRWAAANGFAAAAFMTDAGANSLDAWSDDRVAKVRRLASDLKVKLIIHTLSAVNVAEFVPGMRDAVDQYLAANVDLAAKLDADVIVHAGMHFSERLDMRMRASIEHIARATKRAESAGVTLFLENMNRGPNDAEVHYIGCSSDELKPFFTTIPSDNLKWAFSANHAHLAPEDWTGFVDALGTERLGIVMMADCHGTIEEHLWPGQGNLDFGGVVARLERAGYAGHYFLTFGPKDALLAGRAHVVDRAREAMVAT